MAYITASDISDRYGQELVDELLDGRAAAADAAIAAAETEVNGYLAGVAALPFAAGETPPLVRDIAARAAFCRLHDHLPQLPDAVRDISRDYKQMLRDISAGRVSLGLNAAGNGEQPQTGRAAAGGAAKTSALQTHLRNWQRRGC